MDTAAWLEAGVGSQEMYRAMATLEAWFGWQQSRWSLVVRQAYQECEELHFALADLEWERLSPEERADRGEPDSDNN